MHNNKTNACLYILVLGKFYLVDAGYVCRPGFLPPYRGTRYHLNEYAGRHYPTNGRELFNLRHSSLCVTIERAFGHWKIDSVLLTTNPFIHSRHKSNWYWHAAFYTTGTWLWGR